MYAIVLLVSIQYVLCVEDNNKILGCDKSEYPKDHVKYMRNIKRRQECSMDSTSCKKPEKISKRCWGYEKGCVKEYAFQYPNCNKHSDRWMGPERYVDHFWTQGGFGYVKQKIESINVACESTNEGHSSFKCTDRWHYCEAEYMYMDFRKYQFNNQNKQFKTDVFKGSGDIGGNCKLNKDFVEKTMDNNGALFSWNAELKSYSSLKKDPFKKNRCDEMLNGTTILMKLDSGINMYHHFCDFLNLYISQHILGNFSKDIRIIIWSTSLYPYHDIFSDTWNVFTEHPRRQLKDFAGKRVCFKHAIFPLLPRLFGGLYYNTPLIANCHGGGVLRAFSEHVLHRLGISQNQYDDDVLRVTLLKRSTKHRIILNENELVAAMKRMPGLNVTVVDYGYKQIPFLEQLKITHNSDIFIGMHGAGLTHMIFQPNWGAIFELHNSGDVHCYKDLARLRDLSYFTWEHEHLVQKEEEVPNLKFTNYAFDVKEFERLLTRAIKIVKIKRPKMKK